MRVLIQRVARCEVRVEEKVTGAIGPGLLVLAGVSAEDSLEDIQWLVRKIVQMRIFPDEAGAMNRSVLDSGGEVCVVSQFTLFASTRKGNRPSFTRAAPPEPGKRGYEAFVKELEALLGKPVQTGIFGASMQVDLVNDGPVTIWMDSQNRE
ncbi:MAG: D-tyrosyl-tRNA(Tyr) deacylase [Leptolyngbya sp. SIO3F4]|nr:D-tyrosyl-tRNA(Tyr) deacylase [Leptolyngbya sp. SIO3F4]